MGIILCLLAHSIQVQAIIISKLVGYRFAETKVSQGSELETSLHLPQRTVQEIVSPRLLLWRSRLPTLDVPWARHSILMETRMAKAYRFLWEQMGTI